LGRNWSNRGWGVLFFYLILEIRMRKGSKHTEESRKKMSEKQKGKSPSKETRDKLSKKSKGRIVSEETRDKLSKKLKGLKRTQETRDKISEFRKGRKDTQETRDKKREATIGEKNGFYGKTHTKESRDKMSKTRKGNPKFCGSNSPFYIDGKGPNPYPEEFYEIREKIRIRDDHTCQKCGGKGKDVHHIDYDISNNDEMNLITLCRSCHTKIKVSKMKYWQEYYSELMNLRFSGENDVPFHSSI
jgi:hypothetical protein